MQFTNKKIIGENKMGAKHVIVVLLIALFTTFKASAATDVTLKFAWEPYTWQQIKENNLKGIKIYQNTENNLVHTTPKANSSTASIDMSLDGCQNFFARGFSDTMESLNSDYVTVCEPSNPGPGIPLQPIEVDGFTVEIIVKPIN